MALTKARRIGKLLGIDGNTAEHDSDRLISIIAGTKGRIVILSDMDDLAVNPLPGKLAHVTGNNTFYFSSSGYWNKVDLINRFNPAFVTEPSGTYELSTTGAATTITVLAIDSDDIPIKYLTIADSDFSTFATISHDSDKHNVFTVVPIDSEGSNSGAKTGVVTFRATDGVNVANANSTFTLSFGTNWATGTLTETKRRDSVVDLANGDALGYMNSDLNLDGTYCAVGASKDTAQSGEDDAGGCHVFYYDGSSWDQGTKINVLAMDAGAYAAFGSAVSLSDDATYLAIGHAGYNSHQGGFHIYTRGLDGLGAGWTRRGIFTVTGSSSYYYAGGSSFEAYLGGPKISGNGQYVIITRRVESTSYGEAYIFTGSGSSWSQQAVLRRTGRASGDYFGQSADINKTGEYSIVGADQAGVGSATGVAVVHLRTGTNWAQQAELTPSDGAAGDRFGHDVCISGDGLYAAVTAFEDDESYTGSGSVYVFARSGTSWSQQQKIHLGAAGAAGAHFGQSIDMNDDGDLLTITDGGNNTNTVGTLYIYERSGSTWSKIKELQASDAGDGDTPASAAAQYYGFGSHCSISADGNVVCGTAYPASHIDTRGALYIWNG